MKAIQKISIRIEREDGSFKTYNYLNPIKMKKVILALAEISPKPDNKETAN